MQPTLLRYGLRALAASLLLFLLAFALGRNLSFAAQEVLGYLAIFTSLVFVYFAIRHYRDTVGGGTLRLGRGLLVGLAITVLVGIGSAIADVIYTTVLYPDFVTDYTAYSLEKLAAEVPPEEFPARRDELLAQVDQIGSPAMLALVMFATVVLIGLIVSLVSTLLLRREAGLGRGV